MRNVFFFDNMLTPKIITAVYWFLLLVAVGVGLSSMFDRYSGFAFGKFIYGLAVMAGIAVGARIWCELLIVLFKMNEALQDIRKK